MKKPQDAEKGRIEVRPAVSFVSDATYNDSVKDKAKFIEVMCRYNTASKDVKANNYQIHVKNLIMVHLKMYYFGTVRYER